ncbi:hypothetical protein ACFRMN_17030 [Streptomyces sp. NPDC056835]|uniref:hypothetical protein n=1 Tax=Streptomyces sp. NPDC056835 TaxID=3345956 RepID=UPI00369CF78A
MTASVHLHKINRSNKESAEVDLRNRIKATALGTISSVFVIAGAASPAHAAPDGVAVDTAACATTGANGSLTTPSFHSQDKRVDVTIAVYDSLADGHHVRIRVVGKTIGGTPVNFQWRQNTGGEGTVKSWTTYAEYSSGLINVGLQVARFEGDTLLNSCTDWLIET